MAADGATGHDDDRRGSDRPSVFALLRRVNRMATATFVLVFVGLLVLAGVNRLYLEPQVRDAVEATRIVRLVNEAMLDQETGLRAYLATGEEELLEPYERGSRALGTLLAEADGHLAGRSRTGRLLVELRLAQQAWLNEWVPDALAAGEDHLGGPELTSLLLDGQELFDGYRQAHAAITEELVSERTEALDEQSAAILGTVAIGLALTVASAVVATRDANHLRSFTEAPLRDLLARLERLRGGDLDIGGPVEGPVEVARIHDGLVEAAEALAQSRARADEQATRIATQNRQLSQVLRLAREVAGSLNLQYVLRGVADAARAISDQRVVVWLCSDDRSELVACADTFGPGFEAVGHETVAMGEGVVGRAARFGRVEGHRATHVIDEQAADGEEIAVPMVVGAEVTGVLAVCGPEAPLLPAATLDVLEALAVQAASAIDAARLHEHTETLAMTDALTRLPNRRRLEADLATEVEVSTRHGRPLAVGMVDVDHFKSYNDAFGHQAGDAALQALAAVLAEGVRTGDTVYRYGGEELFVVMRESTVEEARTLLERLRASVEHHFASPGQPRGVTISAGVASLREHGTTAAALVAAADGALYEAKRSGRNRVCVAS